MHGKYECKNAHEKQQTPLNKNSSRSNKKTCQEQLEDHEEHYECINFWKMHTFLEKMQLIPNLKIDSRLKQETQNIFDFYDFLIFLYFYYYFFFEKTKFVKTKKNKRKFLKKIFEKKST